MLIDMLTRIRRYSFILFLLSFFACGVENQENYSVEVNALENENSESLKYEIVFSENDELCNYVQEKLIENSNKTDAPIDPFLNDSSDILIDPFNNDPFGDIEWKPNPAKWVSGGVADFDIDNDGKTETVMNWNVQVDYINTTIIKVFDLGTHFQDRTLKELSMSTNYIGSINLKGDIYPLDKCMENNCLDFTEKDKKTMESCQDYNWCPFATFTLVPFFFNDKTYIAFRDAHHLNDVERQKFWIIVSEYRGGHTKKLDWQIGESRLNQKTLDDICYLKKSYLKK